MCDKIKCVVCGELFNIISWKHLKKHELTVAEYKSLYPTAPVISPSALLIKQKSASVANQGRKGIARSDEVKQKISQVKKSKNLTAWNKDVPMQQEQKDKLSITKKMQYENGDIVHWNKGNTTPIEVKEKISTTLKEQNLTDSEESKIKRNITLQKMKENGWVHPSHRPEFAEKIKQINNEKYGRDNHTQRHISIDTLHNLNNKEWMYNQHVAQQKPLMKIAEELNISDGMVGRYLHGHGIETHNFMTSIPEREVNAFILSLNIETEVGVRHIIHPLELDIYVPTHNIAIEYCGLYWHSEQAGKDKKYHENKYISCKNKGIQLITIFGDEWEQQKDQVKAKLRSIFGVDDRKVIYARKTNIISVSGQTKKKFYDTNHIQADGPSSINIGLLYDNQLVACMSFVRRATKQYELTRYATNTRVVGGFSKILKYFKNNYDYTHITSFADLRWSTGNLYNKTGWEVDSMLAPDYSYSPDSKNRYHKFNYRRNKLGKLLNHFDPALTERENCDNNGILRIWDCGKIRFIMKK